MRTQFVGVDSLAEVSQVAVDTVKAQLNQLPLFWGRYFADNHWGKYNPRQENPVLSRNNIKLLPIARNTNDVGGSKAIGVRNAKRMVENFFTDFPIDFVAKQGNEFLVFQDVEGGTDSTLSASYYEGWAETLEAESHARSGGAFSLKPCIYARSHDKKTWKNLITATKKKNVNCYGLWVARILSRGCTAVPDWEYFYSFLKPNDSQVHFPIFAWQYMQECNGFDGTLLNPNIDVKSDFLDQLILPPND